jgi:hypothetical protein
MAATNHSAYVFCARCAKVAALSWDPDWPKPICSRCRHEFEAARKARIEDAQALAAEHALGIRASGYCGG